MMIWVVGSCHVLQAFLLK